MTAELDRSDGNLTLHPHSPTSPIGPDANLITTLRSLRELGRFEEAAALVRSVDAGPQAWTMTAQGHAAAGPALMAVSEYAAAEVHLLLASVEPALAPAALSQLAEIAWIEHDHPRSKAFALAGLGLDPSHHGCRIQLQRNNNGREAGADGELSQTTLSQAAFFADSQGNAGDRVLTDAVRRCFTGATNITNDAQTTSTRWHPVHVHQLFDERRLAEVNATDGLIVGGGGLFRSDTAPNGNSGWQWNIADDVLARIVVPLVVFAVGYTMFEGQNFDRRFTQSVRTLVERSTFVGLRNQGSVDRIRELLPDHLADRVRWQPCPTTIADLLTDPLPRTDPFTRIDPLAQIEQPPESPGEVLLNCAYDRAGRRFGDGYGVFLSRLRDWVVTTRERADVRYAAHCMDDERFVGDLRREYGLTLPVIPMYDLTPAQIHERYRRAQLVVGMRDHAGMIPFGCGTPIISLISHPELGYFLDDIERPQWGIGVQDPHLAGRLRDLTAELLDNGPAVAADIAALRLRLADVTLRNLGSLPASLHPAQRLGQDKTSE